MGTRRDPLSAYRARRRFHRTPEPRGRRHHPARRSRFVIQKHGAPVATPVTWEEIEERGFHPRKFTLKNLFRRLAQTGDPWEGMWRHARSLREPRRWLDALIAEDGRAERTPRR